MSHVENAECGNGSGRTNDIVENERDKSVAGERSGSFIDDESTRVETKAREISNSSSNPETDSGCEIHLDTKSRDDDARVHSGDICRICHMGRYASIADNRPSRDSQDQDCRTSAPSNLIYLGPLISACKCRGTVALVHVECLERWLTESGRARCELCGYRYATKRVPRYNLFRSTVIWFHTVIATRQMLLDVGYLVMTTPVAAFSCYVCAMVLKLMLRNRFHEIPWMIVAMLPTCLLTLIAYWRWIITLGRLHGHRWRRYWRNNYVIRLIPDNGADVDLIDARDRRFVDRHDAQEDYHEQWGFEGLEEFM